MTEPPAIIQMVNSEVNAAHRYGEPLTPFAARYDPDQDGVFDCENYAVEKIGRLAGYGVAGRIVRGHDARGQSHAVAVAQGYVLNNQYQTAFSVGEVRRLRLFSPSPGERLD